MKHGTDCEKSIKACMVTQIAYANILLSDFKKNKG